jgi:putative heme transporter
VDRATSFRQGSAMSGPLPGRGAVLARAGRQAWALLGLAGVVVLLYLLLREISVLVTPLAIALFPAAVLWPAARWQRGGA